MSSNSYELIDSGNGEKIERFGEVVLRRPDPETLWSLSNKKNRVDLVFSRVSDKSGKWLGKNIPKEWTVIHGGFKFIIRLTSFKHVGLFPEQENNWQFIKAHLPRTPLGKKPNILNLFAYTGGATLAVAGTGGDVTHVDASKPVVDWAKKNAELNGLKDAPIRWIVDDVLAFVKREVKRGKKYDGIVMDPPMFGHGPKNELWKIERDFLVLFEECLKLLSDKPVFFIISGYASGYSPLAFANNLEILKNKFGGKIEHLELTIKESSPRGYLLPAGVTARWSN